MKFHFWQHSAKGILLRGKMRRLFTVRFRPDATRKQVSTRGGNCLQCAACCKLIFRCPWLDHSNHCRVYHSKIRPLVCAHFPVNRHDIADVAISSGRQCGYSFKQELKTVAGARVSARVIGRALAKKTKKWLRLGSFLAS